jgi:hypothetical protein
MNKANEKNLERLLQSAAQADDPAPESVPFGFDTRVIALWRAASQLPNGVGRLVRRVAIISAGILVLSTIAAVREFQQNRELGDSVTNEFAIADAAIQSEVGK